MAIPEPQTLLDIVKVTATPPDDFVTALAAQMADATTVKNGYRGKGLFSFYVPGAMWSGGFDSVRKQLQDAGYNVNILQQIVGYMPSNEIIDFMAAGPGDPNVTGPSTFPWIHVQISKADSDE